MNKLPYGQPYPVSPLIRGARYVFLVAGIFYGMTKQRIYERQEVKWQEQEAKRKIIRDRESAILREKVAREEIETIRSLEAGKESAKIVKTEPEVEHPCPHRKT